MRFILSVLLLVCATLPLAAGRVSAQINPERLLEFSEKEDLKKFVRDERAALQLGKAFIWDDFLKCKSDQKKDIVKKILKRKIPLEEFAETRSTYQELIQEAFHSDFWEEKFPGDTSQIEGNFSLFFILATKLYESTFLPAAVSSDGRISINLRRANSICRVEEH